MHGLNRHGLDEPPAAFLRALPPRGRPEAFPSSCVNYDT